MFLASRRGAFGTTSQSSPCISSNNEVSERFVGSSLRIVLASITPFFVSHDVLGFVSELPNQILLSHAVSPFWSLFPDDNPRRSGAKILNRMVSTDGTAVNGVMRPAARVDLVTQESRNPGHPWPGCRA